MKSSFLLAAAFLSIASFAPAQTAPATSTPSIANSDGTMKVPDGIARVREKTVYIKDGKVTRVNSDLKLSEGITAKASGEVTLADGKTIKLSEGQMVTLDGKTMNAPVGLGSMSADSPGNTQPPVK